VRYQRRSLHLGDYKVVRLRRLLAMTAMTPGIQPNHQALKHGDFHAAFIVAFFKAAASEG